MNPPHTDEELVAFMLQNQQEAFRQIYDRYKSALLVYAMKRVPFDVAEDLVHNVFMRLWNNRSDLEIKERFVGYIFKSLRNRISDFIAKEEKGAQYLNSLEDFAATFSYSNADDLLREKLFMDRINNLLLKYGPHYQLILKMKLEGYSNQEIADKLGYSEKTIRNQSWLLLKYLRSKFIIFLFF